MSAKRILLVDDEPDLLALLKLAFEENKYKTLLAGNGEEALKLARGKKPDAIVLDIKMPKLNGHEFLGQMRRDPKIAHIPVLVFTSITNGVERTDEEWAKSLEVQDFLSKPAEPYDLVNRVSVLIERCQSA